MYLIRHGQTDADVEDRYEGAYDDHLTELGKAQAQSLAIELKDAGIEAIFTSSLIRARETADILSFTLGINRVEIVPDIRERNWHGVVTGMTKAEALAKFPEVVAELSIGNKSATVQGAEEFEDFKNRVTQGFDEIVRKPFQIIAVITHGGPLWLIINYFLHLGQLKNVEDCGYAVLNYDIGTVVIEKTKGFLY